MLNMNTSETLFLHLLLFTGISLIILFKIRNQLVLLENKSLNSSDQVLIICLMYLILMELKYLQDYQLGDYHLHEHIIYLSNYLSIYLSIYLPMNVYEATQDNSTRSQVKPKLSFL